ncbi:helix-turn-helix domain-containing protein [Bradyrhizobium sp. CCGB20]|nr:helix-turn-helix domain-containing protein [Bradyrhizobium sp. CCGB20]
MKPEHVEDLGGLVVKVLNAVVVQRCSACGDEMVGIPDMPGLARAAAMARAQSSERLAGKEVRFIRKALDMKQKDFAAAMDLSPEHVSRWENDHNGIGGASEKLVRHNICALLSDGAFEYDPKAIASMIFVPFPEGGIAPIEMVRVRTSHRTNDEDDTMWSEAA